MTDEDVKKAAQDHQNYCAQFEHIGQNQSAYHSFIIGAAYAKAENDALKAKLKDLSLLADRYINAVNGENNCIPELCEKPLQYAINSALSTLKDTP